MHAGLGTFLCPPRSADRLGLSGTQARSTETLPQAPVPTHTNAQSRIRTSILAIDTARQEGWSERRITPAAKRRQTADRRERIDTERARHREEREEKEERDERAESEERWIQSEREERGKVRGQRKKGEQREKERKRERKRRNKSSQQATTRRALSCRGPSPLAPATRQLR
eukprot:1011251-Rhodomonas_salina.1